MLFKPFLFLLTRFSIFCSFAVIIFLWTYLYSFYLGSIVWWTLGQANLKVLFIFASNGCFVFYISLRLLIWLGVLKFEICVFFSLCFSFFIIYLTVLHPFDTLFNLFFSIELQWFHVLFLLIFYLLVLISTDFKYIFWSLSFLGCLLHHSLGAWRCLHVFFPVTVDGIFAADGIFARLAVVSRISEIPSCVAVALLLSAFILSGDFSLHVRPHNKTKSD